MQKSMSILYLVTEDWYFCLHRLPIARAARDAGFRVLVATRVEAHGALIEKEGFRLIPMDWNRGSLSVLDALSELRRIFATYRGWKPDLVHHVALKPSLLGSVAATLAGVAPVVNNLAGLGQAFSSAGLPAALVRSFLVSAFKVMFSRKGVCTLVENADDLGFLTAKVGLSADSVVLIRGIGVDETRFSSQREVSHDVPVVTMVSRLLWPKGVRELVDAGTTLRERGIRVRIRLVGMPDPTSRVSVPEAQLRKWDAEGAVEWLGHRDDIPEIWRDSTIGVLPSYYREGIPRSLLEAAACGRAIVTTDMPGCREIVLHGENGLLVPPRDALALADAIAALINDPAGRRRMGQAGRARVEREFSEKQVVEQTLALYQGLLDNSPDAT
jgi:glycosyltransferase involved in cell wall biosynthesis